jgi:hypothetical protein
MFKELFVVLKAKFSDLFRGLKEVVGVTQGAAKQMNASAKEMEGALTSAFSGQVRDNITNLSENISVTRENIVQLKEQLKLLLIQQKKQKEGTAEFKAFDRQIKSVRKTLFEAQQDLAKYNIEARDQKKVLADSRLAAEDNSSAMEATSRAVNAATGAILLLGEGSESLKPALKGVSIAMAAVNAVIAVQNLKLRENQVFAKATAAAQNVLRSAFIGTTAAGTALKTILSSLGIGIAIVAISTLVTKIMEISEANSRAEESQKKFNESYSKFGGTEIAKVNVLIAQINDLSLSLDTRKSALKKLQEIFPAYFRNLDDEKILSGQVRIETNKLTSAILANAKAKAFQQRVEENQVDILKLTQKSSKAVQSLAKETKLYEQESKSGADVSEFYATRIQRLKDEITEASKALGVLNIENNKYISEIAKLTQQTEPVIGADPEEPAKVKAIKAKVTKGIKQAVNEQEKLAILETQLNGERLLLFAGSEEEKARILNDTEQRILAIRKAYFIQSLTAQGASQNQALESWSQYQLDVVKAQETANARLQKGRDKDTDNAVANAEYEQMLMQESLDGMLKMQDDNYAILSGALAKEYNDGLVNLEKYNQNKLNAEIAYLEKRIKIYKAYGVFAGNLELQLANLQIKTIQTTEEKKQKILKDSNKQIARAYQALFADLAVTLGNSLAALATSQNPVETFLNGVLNSVAGFMDAFGKSIIAVGIATSKLNFALTTLQGPAAIAAGIALVAAAGVARSLANTGPTAFADGGIVSGPTLGLVGEYPGASTNPEVIAPLDKLKSIIGGSGDDSGFIAETRISGRDLSIVLNRFNKDNARG